MNFLEFKEQFENAFANKVFELLELSYVPYSFGSGKVAYRINAKNIKLQYDGRDDLLTVYLTSKNVRYPLEPWKEIYIGKPQLFVKDAIDNLMNEIYS